MQVNLLLIIEFELRNVQFRLEKKEKNDWSNSSPPVKTKDKPILWVSATCFHCVETTEKEEKPLVECRRISLFFFHEREKRTPWETSSHWNVLVDFCSQIVKKHLDETGLSKTNAMHHRLRNGQAESTENSSKLFNASILAKKLFFQRISLWGEEVFIWSELIGHCFSIQANLSLCHWRSTDPRESFHSLLQNRSSLIRRKSFPTNEGEQSVCRSSALHLPKWTCSVECRPMNVLQSTLFSPLSMRSVLVNSRWSLPWPNVCCQQTPLLFAHFIGTTDRAELRCSSPTIGFFQTSDFSMENSVVEWSDTFPLHQVELINDEILSFSRLPDEDWLLWLQVSAIDRWGKGKFIVHRRSSSIVERLDHCFH